VNRYFVGVVLLSVAAAFSNCAVETNEDVPWYDGGVTPREVKDASIPSAGATQGPVKDAGSDAAADADVVDAGPPAPTECHLAVSEETMPARTVTISGNELPSKRRIFVDDLFAMFRNYCGACHVDGNQGGYQIADRKSFPSEGRKAYWLGSMLRNDSLDLVMPPGSVGGKLAKDRPASDPMNELITLYKAWGRAGYPYYSFEQDIVSSDTSSDPAAGDAGVDSRLSSPYRFSPELATSMTNVGNCIADRGLYATETEKMQKMDEMFASLTPNHDGTLAEYIGLPARLEETDLFTFDSRELARVGVIAWAPTYPVFTDGARAVRHVRVPLGQSIVFHKDTQKFEIPEGTRFYKTFFKPVVEQDGSLHWKKTETRLIVSWADVDTRGVGRLAVTASFGSYVWNEDETEATLVVDPQRNGTPFRDHVMTYIDDEQAAQPIIEKNAPDPGYMLQSSGVLHRYAIPGDRRCMECHMGSPNKSFIIGFQPMQIKRRLQNEGGVIDPVSDDELSQLQRFMDYGLITGVDSASDISNLEDSQGERKPRNKYELKAQGYLLGNCANCHAPRGSMTIANPELTLDGTLILDFLPSATGGIFQFPLTRSSPRIVRGGPEATPIPYITPSLFDFPRNTKTTLGRLNAQKCATTEDQLQPDGTPYVTLYRKCILAPWRSLVYRGVDTPFTYSDDLALFPRMPAHTPGFDCQAPSIVAEWMVSIPAAWKTTFPNAFEETAYPSSSIPTGGSVFPIDTEPQPYTEVTPGDDGYTSAAAAAEQRLALYRFETKAAYSGYSRYAFCPGNEDIMDPSVLKDPVKNPVPIDAIVMNGGEFVMPADGVPQHVHWVILDQTQAPGDWYPRRFDWDSVLISRQFPKLTDAAALAAQAHEKMVVSALGSATISSELRSFATTKLPMTTWKTKASCNFQGIPTVADYNDARPAWMDETLPDSAAPVYLLSPGEYVHNLVCAHCHGVQADSAGREAATLSDMTGGYATVTNFKTGIGLPKNRLSVFGPFAGDGVSADDWAARYFSWMGLGGTTQKIPKSIIQVVATADVMGQPRKNAMAPTDANMLSTAESLCSLTLPADQDLSAVNPVDVAAEKSWDSAMSWLKSQGYGLIGMNGDEGLWWRLCAIDNPRPVRAMDARISSLGFVWEYNYSTGLYRAGDYPSDAPVADQLGRVTNGIATDNLSPWCLRVPRSGDERALADAWRARFPSRDGKTPIPYCPEKTSGGDPYIINSETRAAGGSSETVQGNPYLRTDELKTWAIRGGINAGIAAFLHVDLLTQGDVTPTPDYDECERLN
jgi:mono/diheme cytochrome c family protein